MADIFFVATAFLTKIGGGVVVLGGLAGWYGAFVSAASDRRLRKFLDAQAREIDHVIEKPEDV